MARLGKTIASLSYQRDEWKKLLNLAAQQGGDAAAAAPLPAHLRETAEFGANPGGLRMISYVPDALSDQPALVVVLHGCTQTAAGYDEGAGWSTLARRYGFALLLPEQQKINNPKTCFNWFQVGDTARGRGEARSIRSMIERMILDHGIDRRRVFVTGLSAGGAMTSVMLATYPEVFAGGAIIAGLPYRCATDIPGAFQCMSQGRSLPAQEWGELVRSASRHQGPWPKVSVWHGSADTTVNPINAAEIIKQWSNVQGLPAQASVQDQVDGYPRRFWRNAAGESMIEEYVITGMAHGTPLSTGDGENHYGAAGAFLLDVGISSSYHIAKFWGLTDRVVDGQVVRDESVAHEKTPSSKTEDETAAKVDGWPDRTGAFPTYDRPDHRTWKTLREFDVKAVIEKALKTSGLMK